MKKLVLLLSCMTASVSQAQDSTEVDTVAQIYTDSSVIITPELIGVIPQMDSMWINPWPIVIEPQIPIDWGWIWGSITISFQMNARPESQPSRIYAYQELAELTLEVLQFEDQICVRLDVTKQAQLSLDLRRINPEGAPINLHTGSPSVLLNKGYYEYYYSSNNLQNATYVANLKNLNIQRTCRIETFSDCMLYSNERREKLIAKYGNQEG